MYFIWINLFLFSELKHKFMQILLWTEHPKPPEKWKFEGSNKERLFHTSFLLVKRMANASKERFVSAPFVLRLEPPSRGLIFLGPKFLMPLPTYLRTWAILYHFSFSFSFLFYIFDSCLLFSIYELEKLVTLHVLFLSCIELSIISSYPHQATVERVLARFQLKNSFFSRQLTVRILHGRGK